jgi:hypothetical protein
MMQTARVPDLDHTAAPGRINVSVIWTVHAQPLMGPPPMVVVEVAGEDALQLPLVEHDHVIEALAADRADKALDEWILPWRLGGDDDFFDADVPHAATEMLAVDAVAITQQEAWCFIPGKGFDDLLSRPFRGWVGGHVEVQHTPTMVGEDEEDEQDLIPHGRDDEEVDRDDVLDVVLEECAPGD